MYGKFILTSHVATLLGVHIEFCGVTYVDFKEKQRNGQGESCYSSLESHCYNTVALASKGLFVIRITLMSHFQSTLVNLQFYHLAKQDVQIT